jgi:hypothetical protein
MPKKAKAYISIVIALGLAGLLITCSQWECASAPRYLMYLAMAVLAACFKVRLPGFQGTISISFVLLLIGVAELNYAETLLMAGAVAVVQTVWRCKRRPRLEQVFFNVSVLVISAAAACRASREVAFRTRCEELLLLMPVAAVVYFICNTMLVSGVLGLLQNQPVMELWRTCHLWSFPYYLVGAAVAALSVSMSRSVGWQVSLMVLPVMPMAYLYYRTYMEKFGEVTVG